MRIEKGPIIALGYGKYFRSESIVGLERIEEGRGPGKRTQVYVENLEAAVVGSRSETAIQRDLVESPKEITEARGQYELLSDILDTISEINPMLRSIIRDQGEWDLDHLERRIEETLGGEKDNGIERQFSLS